MSGSSASGHLEWLVRCRSQNQKAALELFKLFERHLADIKKNTELSRAIIPLVAVTFSLWRAVFLAEKKNDTPDAQIMDAFQFLEVLIADNAISYPQDKRSREWTFRYYINNAHLRFEGISRLNSDVLPNYKRSMEGGHLKEWEACQGSLDTAIGNLSNLLNSVKSRGA